MRDDEEFFRQIAMNEIVCPCGEDCLDQKGTWKKEPKERASKKTGNPMITKHSTLTGLMECMAAHVMDLHDRWLKNPAVRIKLTKTYGDLTGVDLWLRVAGRPELFTALETTMERLRFYKYSVPSEINEAASDKFGIIWHETLSILKTKGA